MLSLLCLAAALAYVLPNENEAGLRYVYSTNAIYKILEGFVIPMAIEELTSIALPDFEGQISTPVGSVTYEIHDMRLENISITIDNLKSIPETSYSVTATLNFSLKCDYKLKQLSFPYIEDEGTVGFSSNETPLYVQISAPQTDTGIITVVVEAVDIDFSNFDITIDSDMAWIYELFISIFEDKIADILSTLVETAVYNTSSLFLEIMSVFIHPCQMVPWYDMEVSYEFTSGAHARNNAIMFDNSGKTRLTSAGECSSEDFSVHEPVPEMPYTISDADAEALISRVRVEQFYDNIRMGGGFNSYIADCGELCNGASWPDLNMDGELAFDVTFSSFKLDSLASALRATMAFDMTVSNLDDKRQIKGELVLSMTPVIGTSLSFDVGLSSANADVPLYTFVEEELMGGFVSLFSMPTFDTPNPKEVLPVDVTDPIVYLTSEYIGVMYSLISL